VAKEKKRTKGPARAVAAREPFGELRDWRPFGEGFPSRLERLLREFDEDWTWPSTRGGWLPALDVHETDDHYAVSVELPGVARDDVTIEFNEGLLTIRGEKRSEREEQKEKRRFVERHYGTFSRSFSLPGDADADHIDADFKDGVLTLTIPKTEESKPRTIAIK
jgi:HSP20 family protein